MWISKTRRLALREELDMDTGAKSGKSHHSVRYEYETSNPRRCGRALLTIRLDRIFRGNTL